MPSILNNGTLTEKIWFTQHPYDRQPTLKGKSMKKVKSEITDELRPEYKRSDFGEFVRGKYANRIKDETNAGQRKEAARRNLRIYE